MTTPFQYKDGALIAPNKPGLGVTINPDALARAEERYNTELHKWQHRFAPDSTVPSRQQTYWHNHRSKTTHDDNKWWQMWH